MPLDTDPLLEPQTTSLEYKHSRSLDKLSMPFPQPTPDEPYLSTIHDEPHSSFATQLQFSSTTPRWDPPIQSPSRSSRALALVMNHCFSISRQPASTPCVSITSSGRHRIRRKSLPRWAAAATAIRCVTAGMGSFATAPASTGST
eukprot:353060-Chlamydomonas_euryale.AAC.1